MRVQFRGSPAQLSERVFQARRGLLVLPESGEPGLVLPFQSLEGKSPIAGEGGVWGRNRPSVKTPFP